jgi:hypothetical protein
MLNKKNLETFELQREETGLWCGSFCACFGNVGLLNDAAFS